MTRTLSKTSRQKAILEYLSQHGETNVAVLARHFHVSEMTVRRDLDELTESRQLIRTHGGAAPMGRVAFDFQFMKREGSNSEAKSAIAATAASLLAPGMSILLDSGTTTLAVARASRAVSGLTVITTSLPIASELQYVTDIDVLLLGGRLRRESPDLIGPLTEYGLEKVCADITFVGAESVDQDGWVYSSSLEVARLLQHMIHMARKVYIVADSSKVGRSALARMGNLSDYTGFITDSGLPPALRKAFKRKCELLVASV